MPSVRLAVAEFLKCEAHHLLRNLNASEIHVEMMSCPVWSIAHVFALKAFLQLLNCAALTGNCSILTRDKSFDLYISFSVNLIEPPAILMPLLNPMNHHHRHHESQTMLITKLKILAMMVLVVISKECLDETYAHYLTKVLESFLLEASLLGLLGWSYLESLHKLTLTMLDLKQWD